MPLLWSAVCLFVSGIASLVFQVLWIKQLSLVVGIDVYAVTTGVSAFFAGLAAGGFIIGRLADRVRQPLLLYAALESGVAILGFLTTWLLARSAPIFVSLEYLATPVAWLFVVALIGIPAFLMGGTLPVLVRFITRSHASIGMNGGRLYAANTCGAVVGALLSTFVLLPRFGIQGTGLAASAVAFGAAIVAVLLSHVLGGARTGTAQDHAETPPFSRDGKIAIALYSIAGAIALGYEVVWSQAIVQFMSTRAFAFSVVLATYLAGLATGAALFSRWADRIRNPWGVFGLLISLAGFVSLLEIFFLGEWLIQLQSRAEMAILALTGSGLAGMSARFFVAAASFVLLPTIILGAAFPAALRLVVGEHHVGRGVGTVTALNTLGGIAGAVVTGFILIPQIGLIRTLAMLAICSAMIGIFAALRGSGQRQWRYPTMMVGAAVCLIAVLTPIDKFATLLPGARKGDLVFYEEGRGATVAVVRQTGGKGLFQRLYIQGVSNTGDSLPSLRYMRLQALIPLIIQQHDPKSALVVGLGTGITAGAMLNMDSLDQRVVAELLPGVVRASSRFEGNYQAHNDPRIEIRLNDGRRELLKSSQTYDLITLEPPPPSAAGVANLYSTDFYTLAASRLAPNGMVAQWLPLPTQNGDDTRALVRSFIDVFPHASLWTTELHEMLMIGSLEPMVLDLPTISQRFDDAGIRDTLAEIGVASPAALLSTWITDRDGLVKFSGSTPPVTDDRPRIEYAPWVRPNEFAPVLAELFALRKDAPVKGVDENFWGEFNRERDLLDTFYQAGIYAYIGDRRGWGTQMDKLRAAHSQNPYYAWFMNEEVGKSGNLPDLNRRARVSDTVR
ncbi:MAG: fused MFS/spermidine synthase [Phyllobacterium sp.]